MKARCCISFASLMLHHGTAVWCAVLLNGPPLNFYVTCAEGDDDEEVGGPRDGAGRGSLPGVAVGAGDIHSQSQSSMELGLVSVGVCVVCCLVMYLWVPYTSVLTLFHLPVCWHGLPLPQSPTASLLVCHLCHEKFLEPEHLSSHLYSVHKVSVSYR